MKSFNLRVLSDNDVVTDIKDIQAIQDQYKIITDAGHTIQRAKHNEYEAKMHILSIIKTNLDVAYTDRYNAGDIILCGFGQFLFDGHEFKIVKSNDLISLL